MAKTEDLWGGEMAGLEVNGEPILLVNIDNQVRAYADACPHQKGRLSEGTLTQKMLRCARHHWEFDACTGAGLNPRNTCLRSFPVKVEGGDILIDMDLDVAELAVAQPGEEND
ncbi:MAG TPA: Rieske 2Fe-2S domain-containing protein [Candidatus Binatia bacterium]|nr:Rieske 2Fe-2S domain-containing protein [Candidatus Binatia bacterium]